MIFGNRHFHSSSKSMIFWGYIVYSLLLFRIGNTAAFLNRPVNRQVTIPTAKVRYDTDSFSLLKVADKSNVITVTDLNYRELFQGDKFLLLDAFAQWCGPCKLIEPLLEKYAEVWKDKVVVGKFDVDDTNGENSKSRDLKVELILQGVMPRALPSLILVHKNKVLDTWKGVISPTQLQDMLEKRVELKQNVESAHTFKSTDSMNGVLFCENGICKMPSKSFNYPDHGELRPFRGIGLVNNF